jgi:hypothetical protein
MQTKEFTDYTELEKFVQPLIDEKKWAIDIRQSTAAGNFKVCWIEHKNYTAHDGQSFPDEIWTTEVGEMKCIQDLEPEHAKNVLRMMLRQEREQRQMIQAALRQMAAQVAADADDETVDQLEEAVALAQSGKVLH